jgi:hypothetical protein
MIFAILILSLVLNLYGINWGLPSQERTNLVFPNVQENRRLFEILNENRREMKGDIIESSHLFIKQYSMDGSRVLNFPPDRFPWNESELSLLRSYLLTSSQDEEHVVITALSRMNPARLDFNPHLFHYGGCFIYKVGGALKIASLFDWVHLTPDLSYYFTHPEAMAKIYLAGRLVVVCSVLLSAFLLYLLGQMLYGRETGLFAALFFVISPGVVASAHIMKPHLFAVCFVLLFLIFTLKIKESGARSSYILAGLSLGLAVGSAIYLAIFFIHLLTCHLLRFSGRGMREYLRSFQDRSLLFALCSMLLAFLITNPYYLLSLKEVLYEKSYDLKLFSFALSSENLSSFTFSFFYTVHGIPMALLVFVGLFYALARGREYWFMPLLPIFYFLIASAVIGKGTPPNFRFALALIPFSALLAGLAAYRLWSLRKRWIHFVLIGVMAFTFFHALLYSFNFRQDASSGSTFVRSGEWINRNIPRGSSIGLLHLFTPSTTPPLDFRAFKVSVYTPRNLSSGKGFLPQYFVATKRIDDILVPNYQLTQSFFPHWPLSTLRFKDHFALANRGVFIYRRIAP